MTNTRNEPEIQTSTTNPANPTKAQAHPAKKRKEDVLNSSTKSEAESNDNTAASQYKPPPFFIKKNGAKATMDLITNTIKVSEDLKPTYVTMNDGTVKILTRTEEVFRKVRQTLDNQKTEYHSHQLKSDKLYRIVVRGLHPETDIAEIKSELTILGHNAEKITNVIATRDRTQKKKTVQKLKYHYRYSS